MHVIYLVISLTVAEMLSVVWRVCVPCCACRFTLPGALTLPPPLLAACCAGKAGVSFSGPAAVGYRANLWLRAAIRVLQLQHETLLDARRPAGEAVYESFREAADWPRLLQPGQSFSVDGRVWSCSNLSSSQVGADAYTGLWVCCMFCTWER